MDRQHRWFDSVPTDRRAEEIAAWFGRSFVSGFEVDCSPRRWPATDEDDQGIFPITLLCLAHCTAAAGLARGTNDASSTEVIQFIHDWFGACPERSGARYQVFAGALYSSFRHGLVHQRHSGVLDTEDGRSLGWAMGRDGDREHHLVLQLGGMVEIKTGKPLSFVLSVQPDILFTDTLHVFKTMQAMIAADEALAFRVHEGAWQAKHRRLKGSSKARLSRTSVPRSTL